MTIFCTRSPLAPALSAAAASAASISKAIEKVTTTPSAASLPGTLTAESAGKERGPGPLTSEQD